MRAMTLFRISMYSGAVLFAGFVALQLSLPSHPPAVADEMFGVHAWWYMGRASGFVAFAVLLASVLLGLGVSSRVFDGLLMRPWVFDMHQFLSLLSVAAMLFHALVLLPDPYAQFSVINLFVPFASPYRPFATGLGAIALYGTAIVVASTYAKRWIGQKGWRLLHFATFPLFAGAVAHGVLAGTDSGEAWAQTLYLGAGLSVLFLTFFRILAERNQAKLARSAVTPRPRAGAVPPSAA